MPTDAIRPLAAAHFRDALEAAADGKGPAAIAALLNIDTDSWTAIQHRLNTLGTDLVTVLAHATGGTQ